jgi:hypothetical protein
MQDIRHCVEYNFKGRKDAKIDIETYCDIRAVSITVEECP